MSAGTDAHAEVRPRVFVHTNQAQYVGALVSAHSLKRNSSNAEKFDVEILHHEEHAFFQEKEGEPYLRDGVTRHWKNDDLQSFTPLRFMPPERMGYRGRAVVIDPDIFAVGDVWELLTRDMQGHAVMSRKRSGAKGLTGCYASSVMLLDCAKLTHWRCGEQFAEMFDGRRDYMEWICLKTEPAGTIGLLENHWNDFDRLTPETRLLHNTKRRTQPWKTGLPVDFVPAEKKWLPPVAWAMRLRRKLFGDYGLLGHYAAHPDKKQESFFFGLLRECVDQGVVSEDLLREEMRRNHIRHDAIELMERTPVPAA